MSCYEGGSPSTRATCIRCAFLSGQIGPFVRRDPLTQECQWFRVTKYERTFFGVPVPELLELVMAANYLDIDYLYLFGCQAIAALIKDKGPTDIRHILRQKGGLSLSDYADIRDRNPWLDPKTSVLDLRGDVSVRAYFIRAGLLMTDSYVLAGRCPRADAGV